jgi:RNA polymerase sigma factor for flagellar operon FliA
MYNSSGKKDIKTDLVLEYAWLVKSIAYQCKAKLPANIDIEDLIQSGMIGLLDAGSKFQTDGETTFKTYASLRINGAIMDELRRLDWLPRSVRKQMGAVEKAMNVLYQRLGRNPTDGEVAKELKVDLAGYHEILKDGMGHQILYLEDFQAEGDDDSRHIDLKAVVQDNANGLVLRAGAQFKRDWRHSRSRRIKSISVAHANSGQNKNENKR